MNVMVMDVEGTDGRERGEDQVSSACNQATTSSNVECRISSVNQLYSPWLRLKSSSLTCGNIKSVFTKVPTWVC